MCDRGSTVFLFSKRGVLPSGGVLPLRESADKHSFSTTFVLNILHRALCRIRIHIDAHKHIGIPHISHGVRYVRIANVHVRRFGITQSVCRFPSTFFRWGVHIYLNTNVRMPILVFEHSLTTSKLLKREEGT